MSLKERIQEDMKAAMRAREADRLSTIRMLLAACKQREVDERIVLDDAAVVSIVDKLIKQRKDSIAAFEQAGRTDLSRQLRIVRDQQRRNADQALRQHRARSGITAAHDHQAAARQAAGGRRPVRLAVIGHQHQRHLVIETRLMPC